MSYEDLVESRIQDAMASGAFDRLKGAGKPFGYRASDHNAAGEQWAAHHILENGGMLPEWLMLAREIEAEQERLRELDRQHAALVATQAWDSVAPEIRRLRQAYERGARELRRKQDRFNHDAPSIALERPGIWVEYHLRRLDQRLHDADAPEWLLLPMV